MSAPRSVFSLAVLSIAVSSLAVLSVASAVAQGAPAAPRVAARSFRALAADVPQASGDVDVRELRIRWTAGIPAVGATASTAAAGSLHTLSLSGETRSRQQVRRQRRPEVSANDLVIVVQDAGARELDWRIVPNPRILRAEVPDTPGGPLTGRTFERQDTELLVAIPDTPDADRVLLYSPRWTGVEFELDLLAQLPLGRTR
jgi:hypothetical protein